jgi:hypothetical protein
MQRIARFIDSVRREHKTGIAGEHAYRPALHTLLDGLGDDVHPVNDGARIAVGAPDFIVLRNDIQIGHLEAKDIDIDIRKLKDANRRQHERYVKGLPNLIYTNCLDWDFYRDGDRIASVGIADYADGIQPIPENFARLENLLRDFVAQHPRPSPARATWPNAWRARPTSSRMCSATPCARTPTGTPNWPRSIAASGTI